MKYVRTWSRRPLPCDLPPPQIETQKAEAIARQEHAAAQDKRVAELEKALRAASDRCDTLNTKLESSEFARSRLEREINSHKAQAARNEDEAGRVLRAQLEENSGRILELEGRLAVACKEARAFQHRAADAERAAAEAGEAAKATAERAQGLTVQLEAVTTERQAFKDRVCAPVSSEGRGFMAGPV